MAHATFEPRQAILNPHLSLIFNLCPSWSSFSVEHFVLPVNSTSLCLRHLNLNQWQSSNVWRHCTHQNLTTKCLSLGKNGRSEKRGGGKWNVIKAVNEKRQNINFGLVVLVVNVVVPLSSDQTIKEECHPSAQFSRLLTWLAATAHHIKVSQSGLNLHTYFDNTFRVWTKHTAF